MPRRFYKHKVLLDENMPQRNLLPRLNEHFDVKHVRDDFRQAGAEDPNVYDLAVDQGRIIVTYNWTDFLSLVGKKDDAGVIGVGELNTAHLDTKLAALLMKHKSSYFNGKLRTLGEEEKKLVK